MCANILNAIILVMLELSYGFFTVMAFSLDKDYIVCDTNTPGENDASKFVSLVGLAVVAITCYVEVFWRYYKEKDEDESLLASKFSGLDVNTSWKSFYFYIAMICVMVVEIAFVAVGLYYTLGD